MSEQAVTVDAIIARIEAQITASDLWDPPNGVGCTFRVWDGKCSDMPASRTQGDYVVIERIDWNGERVRLLPETRDRIVVALEATASFDWSQADEARAVLVASGLWEGD